jgi:hypothetical protein
VDDLQTNVNKIPGIESSIPTIPSDLNEEWETVKENANREIPTIPSDLNTKWEIVKANASNPTTSIFHQYIINYITTNNPNSNLF